MKTWKVIISLSLIISLFTNISYTNAWGWFSYSWWLARYEKLLADDFWWSIDRDTWKLEKLEIVSALISEKDFNDNIKNYTLENKEKCENNIPDDYWNIWEESSFCFDYRKMVKIKDSDISLFINQISWKKAISKFNISPDIINPWINLNIYEKYIWTLEYSLKYIFWYYETAEIIASTTNKDKSKTFVIKLSWNWRSWYTLFRVKKINSKLLFQTSNFSTLEDMDYFDKNYKNNPYQKFEKSLQVRAKAWWKFKTKEFKNRYNWIIKDFIKQENILSIQYKNKILSDKFKIEDSTVKALYPDWNFLSTNYDPATIKISSDWIYGNDKYSAFMWSKWRIYSPTSENIVYKSLWNWYFISNYLNDKNIYVLDYDVDKSEVYLMKKLDLANQKTFRISNFSDEDSILKNIDSSKYLNWAQSYNYYTAYDTNYFYWKQCNSCTITALAKRK